MRVTKEIALILAGIVVTTIVLARFSDFVAHLLNIEYGWKFELCMVTGQVLFQSLFLLRKPWSTVRTYTSRLLTVSLVGSLMLLPIIGLNSLYPLHDILNLGWFFGVVLVMFFLHRDYVEELRLPWYMCYTWVLYRFLILIFIL